MAWTDYAKSQMFAIAVTNAPNPANFYLAMYSTSADPAGAPTELALAGYARQVCVMVLNAADDAKNAYDLSVGPMAAGSYLGVAILDASAAGNIWFWDDEAAPITITAGSVVTFANGSLHAIRVP